ncbi:MAG: adenylate kinase [Acidobacteriota bacterium]|jgi:adenylate kinase|nr:adenylate kinase [Acidobacteriota bacterium]
MKLVVSGAPGAGKGTQAHFLAEHYGIPHISTGALLREHIKNGSPIGIRVEDLVNKGMLVSNDIVVQVVKDRLALEDCRAGFILDGFPRSIRQAEITEDIAGKLDRVIFIHVDDKVIIQRISGRRICGNCGATWHLVYNPTKDGHHCDACGGKLAQRVDDKAKTVRERLSLFHKETDQINEYFKSAGLLLVVKGLDGIDDTKKCIIEALEKR